MPYEIHEFITKQRRKPVSDVNEISQERHETSRNINNQKTSKSSTEKEYSRMPRISLPKTQLNVSLQDALLARTSQHNTSEKPLPLTKLGTILSSLSYNKSTRKRLYPSGGAKYPIETYIIARNVSELQQNAYHYHPHSNSLENLWGVPQELNLFLEINKWAENARVIILFTANWWKSAQKYGDFSYLLGLIEIGHMSQNILLSAASLNIPACPIAGFDDQKAIELFELEHHAEQPVYSIILG